MTFGPPFAYHRSCVPIAVSALLDIPVEQVAAPLWRAGAARRLPSAPGLGSSSFGTDTSATADVLMRLGCSVAWWSGTGHEILDARRYARFLSVERAEAIWAERDRHSSNPSSETDVRREPRPSPKAITVREWAERFAGRWLLVVPVRDVALATHALGFRDGELVAGGPGFDDAPVVHGYLITPPPP